MPASPFSTKLGAFPPQTSQLAGARKLVHLDNLNECLPLAVHLPQILFQQYRINGDSRLALKAHLVHETPAESDG